MLQPVFVLNSGYDPVSQLWQYSSLEDASDPAHSATVRDASWSPCLGDFSTCNSTQLATVQRFHSLIVEALAPATDAASPHGVFLTSCSNHCQGNVWSTGTRIGGKTMADAVGDWLSGKPTKLVEEPWSAASRPHSACAAAPGFAPVTVAVCGAGGTECVCSDWFDRSATAAAFDPDARPRVEVCVHPGTGQANGLAVLDGDRTEVTGPPLPAGCVLRSANVTNGAQGEVLVSRMLSCAGGARQESQEILFRVAANATSVECTDSAASVRAVGSDCSPIVRGCCVSPAAQPSPLKHDDAAAAELVLPRPMLGWSTWESFGCFINSTLLESSIRAMAASPLKAAGYNWILIDDCWTTCKGTVAANGLCSEPGDRDAAGRPVPDPVKFPRGFAPLTALAHSLGLRVGIYTSVSAATCAGYTGAFQHEATDAAAFVEWGFDSVKHDSCGRDFSVHDGSFQAAVSRMRDGIWAAGQKAGRKIVYYLDSGNPTSPQRVFNPYMHGIPEYASAMEIQQESYLKLALKPEELTWVWATKWGRDSVVADPHDARGRLGDDKGPHMIKSWFDRQDSWPSVLTNAQNQIRVAEYQRCSQLHMPDYCKTLFFIDRLPSR